jgi:hypothetical protein
MKLPSMKTGTQVSTTGIHPEAGCYEANKDLILQPVEHMLPNSRGQTELYLKLQTESFANKEAIS